MTESFHSIRTPHPHLWSLGSLRFTSIPASAALVGAASLLMLVLASCSRNPSGASQSSATPAVVTAPQGTAQPAKATIYKCPMHPEVTSDKPGKCSVCGMNLEQSSH